MQFGLMPLMVCLAASFCAAAPPAAQLISRSVLFGNPDRESVRVSPDGKHLSWLAPLNGVMNVFVAPLEKPADAKPVTHDAVRGIRIYQWAYTSQHLIYLQDAGGNENWNVHVVDIADNKDQNLTANKDVAARIEMVSPKHPDEILVMLNDRNPQFHDAWRINLRTGEKKLVWQNPGTIDGGMVSGVMPDDDLRVRFAITFTTDGGQEIFQPLTRPELQDGTPGWESFAKIPMEDTLTTSPEIFESDGQTFYMTDSRDRDTGALKRVNIKTGDETVVAEDPAVDVSDLLTDPRTHAVQAVAFEKDRKRWKIIDPALEPDFKALDEIAKADQIGEAEISISSRTLDDSKWTVAYIQDDGPVRYYLYDRSTRKALFLFSNRAELEPLKLAPMRSIELSARDGLKLVSYLTLPPGSDSDNDGTPDQPLPMVLLVHGGPWARDSWGLNSLHQWLANRGYAVLSVNYRGSTGFGKKFVNAGNREWGAKMHDDLVDAVHAMIAARIADPSKVAIMGGSYGGYATLVGLTFTPDLFACGVDIVGPSNINTLLATIPPYWAPAMMLWNMRVGDSSTAEGKAFLDSRSPLSKVNAIQRPLLIGQGANDPRVKQAESDQIVKAMQAKNIPVTYVLYPDEGHGFARPENRKSFFAITEAFLGKYLGGAVEPIGMDFKGSSITIPAGAENVQGLKEQLGK